MSTEILSSKEDERKTKKLTGLSTGGGLIPLPRLNDKLPKLREDTEESLLTKESSDVPKQIVRLSIASPAAKLSTSRSPITSTDFYFSRDLLVQDADEKAMEKDVHGGLSALASKEGMISRESAAKFLRSVLEDFGVIGHVLEEVVENLLNILDSNKDGSISLSEVEESASMIEKILNIDDTGAKYTRFFKWLGYDLSNKGETIREHTRLKFSTVKEHDEHIYNSAVKFATREILFGVVFAACSMLILFSLPLADPYSSPKENWLFIFVLLPCELAYVAWWLDANFTMMAPVLLNFYEILDALAFDSERDKLFTYIYAFFFLLL